jgi:hypothetical protein
VDRGRAATGFFARPRSGATGSSRVRMSPSSSFDRLGIRLTFVKVRC